MTEDAPWRIAADEQMASQNDKSPKPRLEVGSDDGEEWARRYSAYVSTGSDAEAAAELGMSPSGFTKWRKRNALPPKFDSHQGLSDDDHAGRWKVYEETKSDAEASEQLGISPTAFARWRNRQGLEAKGARGGALDAAEERRRMVAYGECSSDAEAARQLGMSVHGFAHWRKKRGLEPKWDGGALDADEERRRMAAYEAGATDAEAARRLGISLAAVTQWRHARSLPPHGGSGSRNLGAEEHRRRMEVHGRAHSDAHAARILGLAAISFTQWRRRNGIPPVEIDQGTRTRNQEFARAYVTTEHDGEAAAAIGVPVEEFIEWRIEQYLDPKGPAPIRDDAPQTEEEPISEREMLQVYLRSSSVTQAARQLGMTEDELDTWRARRGLPAK